MRATNVAFSREAHALRTCVDQAGSGAGKALAVENAHHKPVYCHQNTSYTHCKTKVNDTGFLPVHKKQEPR
ncbi:hypothetical protein [Undibacterium sp. TJN19]|uniref:hypothetical protein n=1 Tax=Undibacterium sp. TJN19 TaxID=3413055 RepID=UPI003BEFA5B5